MTRQYETLRSNASRNSQNLQAFHAKRDTRAALNTPSRTNATSQTQTHIETEMRVRALDFINDAARDLDDSISEVAALVANSRKQKINGKTAYWANEAQLQDGTPYIAVTVKSFRHGQGEQSRVFDWKAALRSIRDGIPRAPRPAPRPQAQAKPSQANDTRQADIARYNAASPDAPPTEYFKRKGINEIVPFAPVRFATDEKGRPIALLLIQDTEGNAQGTQTICDNGAKIFSAGLRKTGHFVPIGDFSNPSKILIAEGFATAASGYLSTGIPAVAALDAGNLDSVIAAVKAKYPQAEITICGDDDQWKPEKGNEGRKKATAAALKYGCKLVLPDWTGLDQSGKPTDFNDLHALAGLDAIRIQIEAANHIEPEPEAEPEAKTDRMANRTFNRLTALMLRKLGFVDSEILTIQAIQSIAGDGRWCDIRNETLGKCLATVFKDKQAKYKPAQVAQGRVRRLSEKMEILGIRFIQKESGSYDWKGYDSIPNQSPRYFVELERYILDAHHIAKNATGKSWGEKLEVGASTIAGRLLAEATPNLELIQKLEARKARRTAKPTTQAQPEPETLTAREKALNEARKLCSDLLMWMKADRDFSEALFQEFRPVLDAMTFDDAPIEEGGATPTHIYNSSEDEIIYSSSDDAPVLPSPPEPPFDPAFDDAPDDDSEVADFASEITPQGDAASPPPACNLFENNDITGAAFCEVKETRNSNPEPQTKNSLSVAGFSDTEWQSLRNSNSQRVQRICGWLLDGTIDRLPKRLECLDGGEWMSPGTRLIEGLKIVASGNRAKIHELGKSEFQVLVDDVQAVLSAGGPAL